MAVKSKETLLSDYAPPVFLVDKTTLDFDIRADEARVTAKLNLRRNPKSKEKAAPLFLNGENQKLVSVALDGRKLSAKEYRLDRYGLTIPGMPAKAELEIVSEHNPHKNTALSGLYASGQILCTQCEAEGFRRITYYPDRPDVMSKFRVTVHADKETYPALLSNGNLIKEGEEKDGRHFAVWEDPHPKPAYLFAMVAGKLDKVQSRFTTKSGRRVLIEIYTEPGKTDQTGFAMTALKKAMKWDEKVFGLEYDLDRFMIAAVSDFNAGAMENKSLNIFNDSCVLGHSETATDDAISYIQGTVGHEYFHNWTGDRITCRDWFQLSLKEGLTVFREQEFSSDMNSRAVNRIDNVSDLRRAQFAEDSGPMAHPVRPDHYETIDNFYTATVYNKGAEVIRMIQTLLGREGFLKGMQLYVKRHDGHAVTCDDFVKAMADANGAALSQFMLWYSQAGTPVLRVQSRYDAKRKTLTLTVSQSTPDTPGQKNKKPLHIPFAVGMIDSKGRDMIGTKVLSLTKAKEVFTFEKINEKPVLSLLRDFSAPVQLIDPLTDSERLHLLAFDRDPFARWEAGQKLFMKYLLASLESTRPDKVPAEAEALFDALGNLLRDPKADPAFKALALTLPSESEIGLALRAKGALIDPAAVYRARHAMVMALADRLRADFERVHGEFATLDPAATDGKSMGQRRLKNLSLSYLAQSGDEKILAAAFKQLSSSNMTDQDAALDILADRETPLRARALAQFEKRWAKEPLVMDNWLSAQAAARRPGVLGDVKKLLDHPAFDIKNPNRVSALIGSFAGNPLGFHAADGSGYRFVAETIKTLDALNPQAAARLANAFVRWRDFEPKRSALMQDQLRGLKACKLSKNSGEIVAKSLQSLKAT